MFPKHAPPSPRHSSPYQWLVRTGCMSGRGSPWTQGSSLLGRVFRLELRKGRRSHGVKGAHVLWDWNRDRWSAGEALPAPFDHQSHFAGKTMGWDIVDTGTCLCFVSISYSSGDTGGQPSLCLGRDSFHHLPGSSGNQGSFQRSTVCFIHLGPNRTPTRSGHGGRLHAQQ